MEIHRRVSGHAHQSALTQNLRDAVCDQMSAQSAEKSRADVYQDAEDEGLSDGARSSRSCIRKASPVKIPAGLPAEHQARTFCQRPCRSSWSAAMRWVRSA